MRGCVEEFQRAIQQARALELSLTLNYKHGHSNTTRSKTYKQGSLQLNCGPFDKVLNLDLQNKVISVEPRITMEQLVRSTLPFGLIPPVVPEFKGITVGGALMGCAAESSSHRFGIVYDNCRQVELLDGQGNLITTSPSLNSDLFYGLSGSYGSLGMMISTDLDLIPCLPSVHVKYHHIDDQKQALEKLMSLVDRCAFVDGIIFSKTHFVIVEGNWSNEKAKQQRSSSWFVQNLLKTKNKEEMITTFDYLFRYDQGAFWMGKYLFSLPFLSRYISQGIFNSPSTPNYFNQKEINLLSQLPFPRSFWRTCFSPCMKSQILWKLLHKCAPWIQERFVIQDLCVPLNKAEQFLSHILEDPALFPIWLCPIQGVTTPQFFAPHRGFPSYINFGLYGVPAYSAPMKEIVGKIETLTKNMEGKKVLYSRSFYSEQEFWEIYPKKAYDDLRKMTYSDGLWKGITEKVLSV